jgi:tetratricopeptide (TPR) repeat protein
VCPSTHQCAGLFSISSAPCPPIPPCSPAAAAAASLGAAAPELAPALQLALE